MYEVVFSVTAEKQFSKLEKETKIRITATLNRIRIRPEVHLKRLVGVPFYSLRTGKYRVIIDLQKENFVVLVIEIGHRKKIYKNIK